MDSGKRYFKRMSNIRQSFYKEIMITIIVFAMLLFFSMFHLQGLPFYMYGRDDFHVIYQSMNMSLADTFISIFFHPLKIFQGFLDLGVFQRAVHGFFLKASYLITGLDPGGYYLIRALFFSFIGVLIYLITKRITKNNLVSFCAALLYGSLPVVYDGVRWIGDSEVFSQFFMILCFYLFMRFYSIKGKIRWGGMFLVFITAILSFKARENGVIVIPVIGSFLLIKFREWKKNWQWWVVIILLMLYIVPAAIPFISEDQSRAGRIHNEGKKGIEISSANIKSNIINLLIYNPYTRIDGGEKLPVIFSVKQYLAIIPGSVLGSLGFLLGWYLIMMIFAFVYYMIKSKGSMTRRLKGILPYNDYFIMLLLWLSFSVFLMMIYVLPSDYSNIRYVAVTGVPFILAALYLCYFVSVSLIKKKIKYISRWIFPLFIILIIVSAAINAHFISTIHRGGIGSRQSGMENIAMTIAQDYYGQIFDNSIFFALTERNAINNPVPCILNEGVPLSEIMVTNVLFLSFTRELTKENINWSLSNHGIVYIASSDQSTILKDYPDASFIREINPCTNGYYCKLKDFIKNTPITSKMFEAYLGREPRFYVYKIDRRAENTLFSGNVKLICDGKEGLPDV